MGIKKENELNQDLAPEMAPSQYVYHPACHCSRCLDRRQATSIKGQFRMILKYIKKFNLKLQASSNKHQAPEATSNKHLTSQDYKII